MDGEVPKMKCKMQGCSGDISETSTVSLRTSCASFSPAHSCDECGRIYWPDGRPVFNRQDHAAFLEGNGIVHKNQSGLEMSRY